MLREATRDHICEAHARFIHARFSYLRGAARPFQSLANMGRKLPSAAFKLRVWVILWARYGTCCVLSRLSFVWALGSEGECPPPSIRTHPPVFSSLGVPCVLCDRTQKRWVS